MKTSTKVNSLFAQAYQRVVPSRQRVCLGGLLAALLTFGCASDQDRETGGETHFLVCDNDSDCDALSAHHCEDGVCRPDSNLDAASDASDASACPRGDVSANELLIIGDSFFAASHEITAFLEDLARTSGALTTGERYRDNSRLIGNALALMGNGIAEQYASAAAEAAVKVVIMNGGGADVLVGSCETADAGCPLLTAAESAAEALLAQLSEDGVQHVVYVFYPDPTDEALRERMSALRPLIQNVCESSSVPCHWLDLRPTFAAHYDEYIEPNGLNPTTAGAEATAQALWALLQQQCIAQ
jgi:hypothetical protein